MMSCQEARERMIDAVFGELEDRDEAGLNEHLHACDDCRAEEANLLGLKRRLIEPAATVTVSLESRLRGALERMDGSKPAGPNLARPRETRLWSWLRRPVPAYVALAAILLVALLSRFLPAPEVRVRTAGPVSLSEDRVPQFVTAGADETALGRFPAAALRRPASTRSTNQDSL